MAPEIHEKRPYDGRATDIFAAAICLFVMVAANPPFNKAVKDETYYKAICKNASTKF